MRIRILADYELGVDFVSKKLTIPTQLPTLRAEVDKVIIHIHGGGFIALNSDNHQIFLRRWAKETQVPVFSIDYRKAPMNPYPDSSNDCYQGYYWIMTQAKKHLGMDIKKVIIAGDSAGGQLALNVVTLAIIR